MIGCYPPGAVENGTLVECTWYETTSEYWDCGGSCGDGTLNDLYEVCEGNSVPSAYKCLDDTYTYYSPSCTSCQPICSGDNSLAAYCGDGYWDSNNEQCDSSADPSGLDNWDCTGGGLVSCTGSCGIVCDTNANPYFGYCGDGYEDPNPANEQCEYSGYDTPTPADSWGSKQYICTEECLFAGGYCNDGITTYGICNNNNINNQGDCVDSGYEWTSLEECDSNHISPSPDDSSYANQYGCDLSTCTISGGYCGDSSMNGIEECDWYDYGIKSPGDTNSNIWYECSNSCLNIGGYCGNSIIEDGTNDTIDYDEACDFANYVEPDPADSNEYNQYECDNSCQYYGGWCGDSNVYTTEECDYQGYGIKSPSETSSDTWYECSFACTNLGGYCGNAIVDSTYGEYCDWSGYSAPLPENSGSNNSYNCSTACAYTNEYCGNSIVEGAYGEECDSAPSVTGGVCESDCSTSCQINYYLSSANFCSYCDLDGDGDNGYYTGIDGVQCFNSGDCNENDLTVYTGAIEICGDDIDNNCNEIIDDGCVEVDIFVSDTVVYDDAFRVWLDGQTDEYLVGETIAGTEVSTLSIGELMVGTHTMYIEFYDDGGGSGCGTLGVTYSPNVTEVSKTCTGAGSNCTYSGCTLKPVGAMMTAILNVVD